MALLLAALGGCASGPSGTGPSGEAPPDGPYVLVLGTAQDGGLPQIGCDQDCCVAARSDPSRRRLVTSLLLVDPATKRRWLFDATPDLPEQVERARGHPAGRTGARAAGEGRPALFDGVFLTHAHIGHYTGLAQLGREAYGARGLPVHGSVELCEYLAANGPWSLMVQEGRVDLRTVEPGRAVPLGDGLSVTPLAVPHRHEFSDTLAFRIEGPRRTLLYLPDIDKWERWESDLAEVVGSVDLALVDGSFFADGEIPDRSMADIPHPFIVETLQRAAAWPASERRKLHFTHLNHTNPAADDDSSAADAVREAGAAVLSEGAVLPL